MAFDKVFLGKMGMVDGFWPWQMVSREGKAPCGTRSDRQVSAALILGFGLLEPEYAPDGQAILNTRLLAADNST
jgi:hypothetical protein